MQFLDRSDAGRKLATALKKYKDRQPVILALPRGGVPVAAVVDGGAPIIVRNEDVIRLSGIEETEFKTACNNELAEIERRRKLYLWDRQRVDVTGRTAIVIDDGIATGATMRAALHATRMRNPKRLVLAVPVAPSDNLATLRADADEVVCLDDQNFMGAIGFYYRDFRQISDDEVISTLQRFGTQKPQKAGQPAT